MASLQVAVYQSVLRAKPNQAYVVAELGARWGTWGSRAIAFAKARRPDLEYTLHFEEVSKVNCEGIVRVARKNGLDYTLECGYATHKTLGKWMETVDHVDLIDMDIQGSETSVCELSMPLLNEKVYRIIVGTHSNEIHAKLEKLFSDNEWIVIANVPPQKNTQCVDNYLRGRANGKYQQVERFNWAKMIELGDCTHDTPRGPVAHYDGELIVDNPRFVDRSKAFSMADTDLKVSDLK